MMAPIRRPILAIQATVPGPLPEMGPLTGEEAERR